MMRRRNLETPLSEIANTREIQSGRDVGRLNGQVNLFNKSARLPTCLQFINPLRHAFQGGGRIMSRAACGTPVS